MSPRQKQTTSYFPHDSNARNSARLIQLRMRHGAAGYGVYFMVLERLREEGDYTSVKDYDMIAFDLRVDASLVKSVVEDFGLFAFTDDGGCFYSESLKGRMEIKDGVSRQRSDAAKKGAARRWGKSDEKLVESSENMPNASQTDAKGIANASEIDAKKSKEKKSKEKENAIAFIARGEFLEKFFEETPAESYRSVCADIGVDDATFRRLATAVIAEWDTSARTHRDYSDAAANLISHVRRKAMASRASPVAVSATAVERAERYKAERDAERRERDAETRRYRETLRREGAVSGYELYCRERGIDPSASVLEQIKTENQP